MKDVKFGTARVPTSAMMLRDLSRDGRRSVALKASGYVAAGLSRVKFKDGRLSLSLLSLSLSLSLSSLSTVAFARRDWALDRSVPA